MTLFAFRFVVIVILASLRCFLVIVFDVIRRRFCSMEAVEDSIVIVVVVVIVVSVEVINAGDIHVTVAGSSIVIGL
jgi:hypothetical protein